MIKLLLVDHTPLPLKPEAFVLNCILPLAFKLPVSSKLPDIIAEPVYGKGSATFKACDAVNAYEAVVACSAVEAKDALIASEAFISVSLSLSLLSVNLTLPLFIFIFVSWLPELKINSSTFNFLRLEEESLNSISPSASLLILVPPRSIVDPLKYISLHLLVAEPRS